MDFKAEYLAFIAAARARNKNLGMKLKKRNKIFKASNFLRSSYQVHHVIPRSCGGKNALDNVVALTPDEHVVAHFLYNVSVQQQKNIRDNYCFGISELNSILKFIPNVLTSFTVNCDFKQFGSVTGTIGDIAKFVCVIKNVASNEPNNYLKAAANVINSCFRRHHNLCVNEWRGKVKFCELKFADET